MLLVSLRLLRPSRGHLACLAFGLVVSVRFQCDAHQIPGAPQVGPKMSVSCLVGMPDDSCREGRTHLSSSPVFYMAFSLGTHLRRRQRRLAMHRWVSEMYAHAFSFFVPPVVCRTRARREEPQHSSACVDITGALALGHSAVPRRHHVAAASWPSHSLHTWHRATPSLLISRRSASTGGCV